MPVPRGNIVVAQIHCSTRMQGLPIQEATPLEERQASKCLQRGAKASIDANLQLFRIQVPDRCCGKFAFALGSVL